MYLLPEDVALLLVAELQYIVYCQCTMAKVGKRTKHSGRRKKGSTKRRKRSAKFKKRKR